MRLYTLKFKEKKNFDYQKLIFGNQKFFFN